ncbi:MAG TPA: tyrosine-type recombinase/integrase [Planctomycetota bacterium]|nr:tyrosine-type recombinase/integrase [Planctomycetota bacterium]
MCRTSTLGARLDLITSGSSVKNKMESSRRIPKILTRRSCNMLRDRGRDRVPAGGLRPNAGREERVTGKKGNRAPSLHELIESYLDELLNHGIRPGTVRTYRYRLGWFGDWMREAGVDYSRLTRGNVEAWLTETREGGLSPKSLRDNRSAVKAFYTWLQEAGHANANPVASTRPVRVPRKLPQVLELHVILRLLEASRPGRERVVTELLYGSGVRRCELLALRLQDLRLEENEVVLEGKGGTERVQPITDLAVRAIKAWLPERAKLLESSGRTHLENVLVTRQGAMCGQTVVDLVKAIAARAAIDTNVYPHLFRHCFATHLLKAGLNLRQVQELLGHARISTTEIYSHVARPELKEAYLAAHPRAKQTQKKPAAAYRETGSLPAFRLLQDK